MIASNYKPFAPAGVPLGAAPIALLMRSHRWPGLLQKKLMTKRAEKLIGQTYGKAITPALKALVEFAAQNSGIEPRNYYDPADRHAGRVQVYRDGLLSYHQERRSISQDWQRFKSALSIAAIEGVTDVDLIAEAPHAFSGRLSLLAVNRLWGSESFSVVEVDSFGYVLRVKAGETSSQKPEVLSFGWDYTTGQYFPTEYRKAAATVLEAAIRRVRQARPKEHQRVTTIAELKALNERNGGCWFGRGEMRFFGTKIESGIVLGHYFISSEQPPHGARKYSVRSFDDAGSVETVGEFCAYRSKSEALAAIPTAELVTA